MLFHTGGKGQHHKKEDHGGNERHRTHGQPHVLTDQSHPDDPGSHRADTGQNAFCLQKMAAFAGVVGKGDDHGIHGNFYQRIGKIIQKVGHHEPCDLCKVRDIFRHQKEKHGEDRKQKERCPVPWQIFSLSCQFSKDPAVLDVQLVNEKAEHHIIAGINDFNDQDRSRNTHQIDPLKKQEQGHECRDDISL